MPLSDSLLAAVGCQVRLAFVDGDQLYCTLRSVDDQHVLVRPRGQQHAERFRIAMLVGVVIVGPMVPTKGDA